MFSNSKSNVSIADYMFVNVYKQSLLFSDLIDQFLVP